MTTENARFMPRKQPVQARSRLTVKAIIEASAQVLTELGYEHATTDSIALRAGVSIGTLYQYFPNKESLVTALIIEHVEEVLTTVGTAIAHHAEAPLETALREIIHAGIEAHRLNPPLHKVLSEQVPRNAQLDKLLDISNKLQSMIADFLRRKAPHLSPERIRMIAFIVESSVEALTHRAVIEAPDWLCSGELETEAGQLLTLYLTEVMR